MSLCRMSPVLPCAAFALAAASFGAAAVPVIPTDSMQIASTTTFVAGEYHLPHGVAIVADDVVLGCSSLRWYLN